MAKPASTIALRADPSDPEDFDVTEDAVETALAQRRKRGGRPLGSTTSERQQVSLRLPKTVVEHFKAGGPGWQTRVIEVLTREAATGQFKTVERTRSKGVDAKRA